MSNTFKRTASITAYYWTGKRGRFLGETRHPVSIDAEWNGSGYVDISFNGHAPIACMSSEGIGNERGAVRSALLEWVRDNYEQERSEQDDPTRNPRGDWLRVYVENSR